MQGTRVKLSLTLPSSLEHGVKMLHVVALVYYPQYSALVQSELHNLERSLVESGRQVRVLVVINNPELSSDQFSFRAVRHDNSGLEFGGYERGLRELAANIGDRDTVLFLNDTFCTHHVFSGVVRKNLLAAIERAEGLDRPMIAGPFGRAPLSFRVAGLLIERWVSTHLFCLNGLALRALKMKLYVRERDADIRGGATLSTFFAPSCDAFFKAHIAHWLFYLNGRDSWYKAAPLNPKNAGMMARKARSIVQEKYLSARLERLSAVFHNVAPTGPVQRATHLLLRAVGALRHKPQAQAEVQPGPLRPLAPKGLYHQLAQL
jgi:hypothetical protein